MKRIACGIILISSATLDAGAKEFDKMSHFRRGAVAVQSETRASQAEAAATCTRKKRKCLMEFVTTLLMSFQRCLIENY